MEVHGEQVELRSGHDVNSDPGHDAKRIDCGRLIQTMCPENIHRGDALSDSIGAISAVVTEELMQGMQRARRWSLAGVLLLVGIAFHAPSLSAQVVTGTVRDSASQ